jgi:hypothetical protein
MSLRSITSSVRHQPEAEVTAAQEREQAAATATRAARLAAAELAAARAKVEVGEAADAARAAAAELEALRGSSAGSSVSGDGSTNDELRLAMEAAQKQAAQWAAAHPHGGARDDSLDRRRRARQPRWARTRRWCSRWRRPGRWRSWPLQATWLSLLGSVPWSPWGPGSCQGHRPRRWVAYPHQDKLRRVGHGDEGTALGSPHVGSNLVRWQRLLRGSTGARCHHCCSPARDAVFAFFEADYQGSLGRHL